MGSVNSWVWNIRQPHGKKEVDMSLGFIFAIGGVCSVLCITFFIVHFLEFKRLGKESEEGFRKFESYLGE
tara:strand:- start:2183 stop:2392 length:210 start_codon:yes stop_codon:yes gene_type:complete